MSPPPYRLRGAVLRRRSGALAAPVELPKRSRNPPDNRSMGTSSSPATDTGEESSTADQHRQIGVTCQSKMEIGQIREGRACVASSSVTPICSSSSVQVSPLKNCKTASGMLFLHEDTGAKEKHVGNSSLSDSHTVETSKRPYVCLERLRMPLKSGRLLVSQILAKQRSCKCSHPGPDLPPEGAITPEPARADTTQTHRRKSMIPIPVSLPYVSLHRILQWVPNEDGTAWFRQPPSRTKSSDQPTASGGTVNSEQDPPPPAASPESSPDVKLEPDAVSEPNFAQERLGLDPASPAESEQRLECEGFLLSEQNVDFGPESPPVAASEQGLELETQPRTDPEPHPGRDPTALVGCVEMSGLPCNPDWLPGEEPKIEMGKMENDDFCAVCLNGGDLLCCDRCPKVFHLSCHIPSLLSYPAGDWLCSLCRDVLQPELEYDCQNMRFCRESTLFYRENMRFCGDNAQFYQEDIQFYGDHTPRGMSYGLSPYDQRRCEKLTLLLSCNFLSAPFQEPVSPLARHYYQIIKRPMDLSLIRGKLNKSHPLHYNTPGEFVADIRLMFRNCAKFNYPDSEVALAGQSLEAFFQSKLKELFPRKALRSANDSHSAREYYTKFHATGLDAFPWPTQKERGYRKRKKQRPLD